MQKIKTAILISGRGSNMKALINAAKKQKYPAEITIVISNKENAQGLKFAQENNIPTAVIDHKIYDDREDFDKELIRMIEKYDCQIICLAGFMRLLSSYFTNKFQNKIINIHPSLLPAFKGANAVKDALKYGVKITGCTTHFVVEEMDAGKIIMQEAVNILENDNVESLSARILEQEHIIYPKTLKIICNKILKND